MQVPDVVEPVQGWRIWKVLKGSGPPQLRSLNGALWYPGERHAARCSPSSTHGPRPKDPLNHATPESACRCGVYAAGSQRDAEELALFFMERGEAMVALGRVALWGKVVVHEKGYRAQFAYPSLLTLIARENAEPKLREAISYLKSFDVPLADVRLLPDYQPAPSKALVPNTRVTGPCPVCETPTVVAGACTNPNHAWAAHQKWKLELKASGRWTFSDRIADLIDVPPRRGQTQEQADNSLLNRAVQAIAFTAALALLIFANGVCADSQSGDNGLRSAKTLR